jgi:hypothetical protein
MCAAVTDSSDLNGLLDESHNPTRGLLLRAQKTVNDCPRFRHAFALSSEVAHFIHFHTKL